ncbi:MAG: hypothetical protein LBT05_02525 [Planctomycetaceae bacterium]|jgi:predicted  nucleic acid-binding Zn-ribbon protein|nr:hypothetical protein [Planctomycetaceae bacterium]
MISEVLSEIHQIQRQLTDLNSRLSRGPKLIRSQENAAQQVTARLEEVRAEYRQLRQQAKFKEEQLSQHEAALARRKTQMQEAKNNKEFQALKLQLSADEATDSALADEALAALEKTEKFALNVEAIEQELWQINETLKKTQESFSKEVPAIQENVARCSERLKEEEKKLSGDFLSIYHRLTRTMGGDQALASIAGEQFCGGCRQIVPINFIAQVVQGKPVTCKSCGRLLYVPEGFTVK